MSVASLFKMFHGRKLTRMFTGKFRTPKALIELGQVHSVVYVCDKLNGGGDGKVAEYEHIFETPAFLYMDETAKTQLYIIGTKLKVTELGIEN